MANHVRARGKLRVFSHGVVARHRSRTRVPTDLYYLILCLQTLYYFFSPWFSRALFTSPFSLFLRLDVSSIWDRTMNEVRSQSEDMSNLKNGENREISLWKVGTWTQISKNREKQLMSDLENGEKNEVQSHQTWKTLSDHRFRSRRRLILVFEPWPHVIGVHVGVGLKFRWECLGVQVAVRSHTCYFCVSVHIAVRSFSLSFCYFQKLEIAIALFVRLFVLSHTFLSFFLGFRRPNLITGLSGWRTPD